MKAKYRKAVQTRRVNKLEMDYYREVTEPGNKRFNIIVNALLKGNEVLLRWNPTRETGTKLRKGAEYGYLVGFVGGRLLKVLPEGYKHSQNWHPSFWEPVIYNDYIPDLKVIKGSK